MADILGSYLKGQEAENRQLDREDAARTERLQRQKLMLDLIHANAKLKPEDARDLARVKDLTPDQGERLLSSLYETSPTVFEKGFAHYSQMQQEKVRDDQRIQMEDWRGQVREEFAQKARELQTPDQAEYQNLYGPLYQQYGQQLPPYSGRTRSEIAQHLQSFATAKNAGTAAQNANQPRPTVGEQPVDPAYAQDIADVVGRPLPPDAKNWTRNQLKTWASARQPKPEATLTPGQELTSRDNVIDYAVEQAAPKVKQATEKSNIYDDRINALMSKVGSEAIARGGTNIDRNVEAILKEQGIKRGISGKEAQKILDNWKLSPDEKKAAIRKAMGLGAQRGGM